MNMRFDRLFLPKTSQRFVVIAGLAALSIAIAFYFDSISVSLSAQAQTPFQNQHPRNDDLDRRFYESQHNQNTDRPATQQRPLSAQEQRCQALEQQLARNWLNKASPKRNLSQINQEINKTNNELDLAEDKADEFDCYEGFLFFRRDIRDTPRCVRLKRRIEVAKERLNELHEERSNLAGRTGTSRQDELISQLARYGCGADYVREDEKRSGGFFSWNGFRDRDFFEEDEGRSQRNRQTPDETNGNTTAAISSKILPFATYRTMCVRQCDGFYYPVSFSTLPSRFGQDTNTCQSRCAAPVDLYVYRNPGETVEQMISLNGQPYSALPNAFRFRKQFVKGCSCKVSEYKPELLQDQPAETDEERKQSETKTPKNQNPPTSEELSNKKS